MTQRTQIYLEREEHRRAKHKASELGISLAEYVRRLVHDDLEPRAATPTGIEAIFDLGNSGGSDVASHKDDAAGEAAWQEYLEETRAFREELAERGDE